VRGKFASLLLIDVILLLASLALLMQPQVRASSSAPLGCLATVLLAAGVPLFIGKILDPRPHLIVDERGIWYRPFGLGFIPWPAIKDITLKTVMGVQIIYLELDQPAPWRAKLSPARQVTAWLNEAMGFPVFNLNLARIGVRPDEIFGRIQQIHECYAKGF